MRERTRPAPGQADRPESRQLLHSLLRYAGSDRFHPTKQSLELPTVEKILRAP